MDSTVSEVAAFDNPYVILGNRYVLSIRIKEIPTDQTWWCMACCKCNVRVKPYGHGYKCPRPQCGSTSASPRYRLLVIAIDPIAPLEPDGAPSIHLFFFGSIAEKVLRVPVDTLVAVGTAPNSNLPAQVTDLIGKQLRVCIGVCHSSLCSANMTYQVHDVVQIPQPTVNLQCVRRSPETEQKALLTVSTGSQLERNNLIPLEGGSGSGVQSNILKGKEKMVLSANQRIEESTEEPFC